MKKYGSYKDSGVEWIGEVPSHWDMVRVKYLIDPDNGIKIGPFGSSLKLDTLTDKGIKVYGQGNIINGDFDSGHRHLTLEQFENGFTQYEIFDGDVLITMMGTTGRSVVFKKEYKRGIMDSHLLRLRFNQEECLSELFVKVLQESDYVYHQLRISSKGSIMEGLNSSIIKEILLCVPKPSEQTQIVQYLDSKTEKIDNLIRLKEEKIELLKEKRTSLINHVVIKGLNPDVEMKDSGVEWIGEIPSHWEYIKMKFLGKIGSGDYLDSKLIEKSGEYPVYGGNGVMGFHYEFNFERPILIIGRVGEKCGNVHYSTNRVYVNDNSLVFQPFDKPMNLKYIYHTLVQRDLNQLRNKNTQPIITGTIVKDEPIPFPPLSEQNQIVDKIGSQTDEIDDLIILESRKIDLLKEYRQSLISEVVLGKVRVCEEDLSLNVKPKSLAYETK